MTAANRHDWMLRAEQRAERHAANRAEHDRVRAEAMEKIHAAGRELRQHKGAIRRAARLMDKANPARALGVPDRRLMTDTELAAWTRALLEAERYDWPATARPEQRQPEDYQTLVVLAGRGAGKLITLGTPLATPGGWTTMGDLRVGDEVFDEAGKPCRVTFVSDVEVPERAYEFTFSDGARITSGGEHQWVTWTHRDRKQLLRYDNPAGFPENWPAFTGRLLDAWGNVKGHYGPTVKTTDQIVNTFTHATRGDTNHCIPLAGALDLSNADLPLDPWLLGYWLGNGHNQHGRLTAGSHKGCMDEGHVEHMVQRAGFDYRTRSNPARGQSCVSIHGLMVILRDMGLLGNKHVPEAYLRAGITQRRFLLAGLLDSDGYIEDRTSMIEFCSTERRLADAVLELARSLGERPTLGVGRSTLYGIDHGAKYRVSWRPRHASGFTLPRKAEKWRPPGSQGFRLAHRMIKSYREVEPVPMRCITVDSPNSMYLIGEAMIPTHNTRMATEAIREWCSIPDQRIAVVAKDHKSLRDVNFDGVSGLLNCVPPADLKPGSYKRGLGDVSLEFANGSIVYGFSSENPDAIRGRAFSAAVADEFAAWSKNRAQDMLDQLRLCLRDSAKPRIIITTTPKRVPHIIDLVKLAEKGEPGLIMIRGKTSDNTALSPVARAMLERMYGGTRIGRQELEGILLTDVDNALFLAEMIEGARWTSDDDFPPMVGVITGVDPSGSETGDATGIVTCGWDKNKVIYVLENRSTQGTPAHRYGEVCRSARRWGAGEIWSESAFSGDSSIYGIEQQWKNLLDSGEFPDGSVCPRVRPSTIKGDKAARAMSVVALYEQQLVTGRARIWHPVPTVGNGIALLEEECLSWSTDSKKSPNAIDALVHAVRQIMRRTGQESVASSAARSKRRIFGGYKPF